MFVCPWIAKIGEDAIAHVLGNKTTITLDQFCAASVVRADDCSQILGIESRR
jgi:hypothetical protein